MQKYSEGGTFVSCILRPLLMMKVFTFIIFVFLVGCRDVVTDNYQTYDDAKNDRLFIRGWLPDILPTTTFDIHVENELDINISTGSFTIPTNDIARFISHLERLPDETYTGEKYSLQQDDQKWIFTVNHQTGIIKYKLSNFQSL